jgi:hypothetical protein
VARGPKTRFLEDAIENGLDSAAAKFPQAFKVDDIAALRELSEAQRKEKLQELLKYWEEIDRGFDG